jgi:hypothetical protein
MPELPEVETVKRGLLSTLEGHEFTYVETRRADLRIPFPEDFENRLTGRRVLEQNAEELRASDGQTKFRDVGIMAAFPRSAFVRGRLVTIFRDLPAEPGVHRGVQVFGRLNWRGDL